MKCQTAAAVFLLAALFVGAGAPGLAAGIPETLQRVEDPTGSPAWITEEGLRVAMDARNQPVGSRLKSVGHLFDYWQVLAQPLSTLRQRRRARCWERRASAAALRWARRSLPSRSSGAM